MQRTSIPGIAMWSAWQPDRNLFFNSFFIENGGRPPDGAGGRDNLVVDPLPLSDADAEEIGSRGGVAWIAITNRDHERDARALARRFDAQIVASEGDAPLLSGPVDRTVKGGDEILGARVIALDGLKTPGEIALNFPSLRTVVVGDAVWGDPAGSVRLMPDDKLADPARAVLSLRAVRAALPENLLLGDGHSILGNATAVLQTMLEARRDAYVNRINRDDVPWREWKDEPPGYGGRTLEIGDYIGSDKIGFRLVEVPPGVSTCPMHWHTAEEELFVMLAGGCTLVTERGEHELRAGDYIAFPTRREGAHKIVNRTKERCELLMIANTNLNDACFYPQSRKVLVDPVGLVVRDNPELDYWDGEA